MVQFNELKISSDYIKLIIDVSVKDIAYYENVYLSEIYIDTQDTFVQSGPSNNTCYKKELYIIQDNTKVYPKSIRLELGIDQILPSLKDNLFFIYIKVTGNPSVDTPCGMDNSTTIGVIYDKYSIFKNAMNYIDEINNTCNIPKNFIDYILKYKAFQYSLNTGHYIKAIEYYNKFIKNINTNVQPVNCNCNGYNYK